MFRSSNLLSKSSGMPCLMLMVGSSWSSAVGLVGSVSLFSSRSSSSSGNCLLGLGCQGDIAGR
jgi:hypothetical protein